jgi:hypothetical protein
MGGPILRCRARCTHLLRDAFDDFVDDMDGMDLLWRTSPAGDGAPDEIELDEVVRHRGSRR